MQTRMMPHLMAYAARNPAFGTAWRARVMEPPRQHLKQLLERAVKQGALPANLDYDLALALLIGPKVYGYFMTLAGKGVPKDLPHRVVDSFWRAHAVTKEAKRTRRT